MQQNVHRHPYCFCTLVGCESVSAASGQISLHAIQFNMATKASALPCTVHYSAQAHLLYNCSARSCRCFSPGQCIASCLPSWIIAGRQCMHHHYCADFVWPPMCMATCFVHILIMNVEKPPWVQSRNYMGLGLGLGLGLGWVKKATNLYIVILRRKWLSRFYQFNTQAVSRQHDGQHCLQCIGHTDRPDQILTGPCPATAHNKIPHKPPTMRDAKAGPDIKCPLPWSAPPHNLISRQ